MLRAEAKTDHPLLQSDLKPLGRSGGELAATLHGMEVLFGDRASEQARRQDIGGSDRILHREVYPDTADR